MFFDRKQGLTLRDFWFEDERNIEKENGADFVQYHDMHCVPTNDTNLVVKQNRLTVVNSLTAAPDEIQSKFKKNTRYEIRRAIKEGCRAEFYIGEDVLARIDLLKEIDKEHTQMFADKGKKSKSELPVMLAAAKAGMLAVSVATMAQGKKCAYHVYIVGSNTARLLHSISIFREVFTNEEKNAIGRANRFLHYEDMMRLKESGYTVYDWGGYSEKEHLKSISEFKLAFGGDIVDVYTFIFASSVFGKLFSGPIRKLKFDKNK